MKPYSYDPGGGTSTHSSHFIGNSLSPHSEKRLIICGWFFSGGTPFCKNHKKPEVDKKIQAYETLTLTKSFVFSSCRSSKQSESRLLALNWSEHFIRWGCFQICSRNNYTLLLYACEFIHCMLYVIM